MTLMAADNPYAVPQTEKPNLIHLAFAVGICSRTHEDGEAWMRSENLLPEVKKWGKSCRKLNFPQEAKAFETYLRDFTIFPLRATKSPSSECHHPWPLIIAVSIMPMVGESRAWNMPLPKAISLWSAYQETQGDDSLVTDWEINNLARMKAEKKAKDKQNEK